MKSFKVGDRVSWNSEAGRVNGTIIRVHMQDVEHRGYGPADVASGDHHLSSAV